MNKPKLYNELIKFYYFPRKAFVFPHNEKLNERITQLKELRLISKNPEIKYDNKYVFIPAKIKPIWKLKDNKEDKIIWVIKQNPDWKIIAFRQFKKQETFDYIGFEPWSVALTYNNFFSDLSSARVKGKKKAISFIAKIKKDFADNKIEILNIF